MRYELYVERRVSTVVEVDAPDLETALREAEMPGETDDVADGNGDVVPVPATRRAER